MLQAILQRAGATSLKLKNFFTVVDVKSMTEFLKVVRAEKNPKIFIFLHHNLVDWCQLCEIRFESHLSDGKTIVLKLKGEVRLVGSVARDRAKGKEYTNIRLLRENVKPPVQIMFALMPNVVIETRDLYGKLVNQDEFKKELF
ncbi:MAG: hypothetical protein Q8Q17_00545 [bacterium]|nr:hypothetical protein [bacterium]